MKYPRILLLSLLLNPLYAQVQVESWLTEPSGRYARLFETDADETALNAVTTWERGAGVQAMPTYAGISEVASTATDVYIRTSGLGYHVMGPWYLNAQRTNLFPNYPSNRGVLYRIPLDPGVPPVNKLQSGLGVIGYFVDGVSMFDSRDAFSYVSASNVDATPPNGLTGDGVWNRDAFVNEAVTFDAGNAHQAGNTYHYHANPPGLRHQIGDSVHYDAAINRYTENFNGTHSPILAWVRDGYPLYGPYGYADPSVGSVDLVVQRMRSGYQMRDGSNGSTNLNLTGRTTRPQWANTLGGLAIAVPANQAGPNVGAGFTLGHYLEDYAYLGDLGFTHGLDFDLDRHNGRFCRTPEFPNGTYAYFVCIEEDGTPRFPYNIGPYYYGTPSANTAASLPNDAVIHFQGGPEKDATVGLAVEAPGDDDVTVLWAGIEGGRYQIDRSPNLTQWYVLDEDEWVEEGAIGIKIDTNRLAGTSFQAYRTRLKSVAAFDGAGFDVDPPENFLTSLTLTLTTGAPGDLSQLPTSLLFNGLPVTIVSRPSQNEITFEVDLRGLGDGDYLVRASYEDIPGPQTALYSVVGTPSILLLIVDDWGIDASPLDNPAGLVPKMPNLTSLAANGLRFTQAYAQPICSPTRASILTGRQPFRHLVGNPTTDAALPASELTLPEIFNQEGAPHAKGSFGKWHLGGGNSGPSTIGGWDKFAGIIQGGVPDYALWNKSEDGATTANVTTYTTSDQVNEAVEYIGLQNNDPWFVWMAFNAPHTPFHEPPAGLAPPGGYSTQGASESLESWQYRRALEALDTEIGRLLQSVDLSRTDIIIIGDNGTPAQVVQAPFGNGHAKGDLYQGGVHVPLVVRGPSVTVAPNSTTDKLVHCVDLFSTILELAGIEESAAVPAGTTIDSTSIVPILNGTDTADRSVVVEKFGEGNGGDGRGIILDDFPDYKLIIFGDKDSTLDTPIFEFYNITTDPNEETPLAPSANQAAYDALIAKDAALGGGYSDPATGPQDILYLHLLDPAGTPNVPSLQNPNGNSITPTSIQVDGVEATFLGRVDSGVDLSNEADDQPEQFWVKCRVSPPAVSYTASEIEFNLRGDVRTFSSDQILVIP